MENFNKIKEMFITACLNVQEFEHWKEKETAEEISNYIEKIEEVERFSDDDSPLNTSEEITRYKITTYGNEFEIIVYDDDKKWFYRLRGGNNWHYCTGIPAIVMNGIPYIIV